MQSPLLSNIRYFAKENKWGITFAASLILLIILFIRFFGPSVLGDTLSYVNSLHVMQGEPAYAGFHANRILTTFLPLEFLGLFGPFVGGIFNAWFVLNCFLYLLGCVFIYKLLARMFPHGSTAFLGGLFLAANYSFFLFGLNYLMDIGGWSFYTASLYFLFKYAGSKRVTDILMSALMVGVGGLFKEYAFLGAVGIGIFLIIEHHATIGLLFKRAVQTAAVALMPTALLYAYVYHRFGYTYLDWIGTANELYSHASWLTEYFKAFGSLINFLAFIFLGGACAIIRRFREIDSSLRNFLAGVMISFLPVFFWPAITQRILTVSIPFCIIIAGFFLEKHAKRWYLFLPLVLAYALMTFFMDSYILTTVNLPF